MRKFLKISAILVLLLVVFLITAAFILKLYFPPEKIKELVVTKITETLGRKVSVGDVDISIFRGVDIHDIYVGENSDYGDLPFIKVKRVTVGYNFRELFHKRIVFDRIAIDTPEAFIRSRNGKLAISDLIKKPAVEEKPKAALPITVTLKRGEVRGLNIYYDADDAKAELKGIDINLEGELLPFTGATVTVLSNRTDNISASAKGMTLASGLLTSLNLKLKGTDRFSAQGDVSLKGLRVTIKEKSLGPLDVGVKLDVSGELNGGAEIKAVSLAIGKGSSFALSGRVNELKRVNGLDIKASGEADLGEISKIVSGFVKVPATGFVKIDVAEVKGDLQEVVSLKTKVSLNRVRVSHKGLTVPLDGYLKAEADNKGKVVLSELKISSGDAVKVEAAASASRFGKGKVGAKARVVADNAKALRLLPEDVRRKMGKVDISGETLVNLTVGRDSEKGPVRVKVSGSSAMDMVETGTVYVDSPSAAFSVISDDVLKGKSFVEAGFRAKSLKMNKDGTAIDAGSMDVDVKASAGSLFKKELSADATVLLKGLRLNKGDINLSNEEVAVSLTAGSPDMLRKTASVKTGIRAKGLNLNKADIELKDDMLEVTVAAATDDLPGRKASIKIGFVGNGIFAKKGDISIKEKAVKADVAASGDFKTGDVSINKLELVVPDFIKASLEGDVKGWGKELALNAGVDGIDHRKALDRMPSSIRQKLPKMNIEGRSIVASSITGGIAGEGKGEPLAVQGTYKTRGFGISLPEKGLTVRKTDGDIDFDISKITRSISGILTIGGVEKEGVLDKPLGVLTGFELSAEGADIKIKKLSVRVPEKAASISLSGDILDYATAPRPNLDMALKFNPAGKTDLLKGVTASGAAELDASIRSNREKEVTLTGGLKMSHLDAAFKDRAKIKDLNGHIRFAQGIRYGKGVELITGKEGKSGSVPDMTSIYDLMRPYMKKGYDLTLTSASFDEYEVGPLSMDIAWSNGNLLIDRYELALFDGGTTGRIKAVYYKYAPEFSLSSNLAGIRLDRIFKDKRGGEEMGINADLNLKGKGTEIEGEVNVTRIGKDLLDRGLLRLDPNESNPQLVDVRRKVNSLGWVPKEVSIWVRHGELNMDITLQRKKFTLLNILSLEKIPVRRVPVGYLIKKGLKKPVQ